MINREFSGDPIHPRARHEFPEFTVQLLNLGIPQEPGVEIDLRGIRNRVPNRATLHDGGGDRDSVREVIQFVRFQREFHERDIRVSPFLRVVPGVRSFAVELHDVPPDSLPGLDEGVIRAAWLTDKRPVALRGETGKPLVRINGP